MLIISFCLFLVVEGGGEERRVEENLSMEPTTADGKPLVVEMKRGYIFDHPPEDRISLWPPEPERRDKSLAYIVKVLSDPTVYERHGVPTSMMMSHDECHEAAKRIEEEAFDAYADEPGEIDSGVRVLRAYLSKIKKAIIDTVKSRGVQPPPASASDNKRAKLFTEGGMESPSESGAVRWTYPVFNHPPSTEPPVSFEDSRKGIYKYLLRKPQHTTCPAKAAERRGDERRGEENLSMETTVDGKPLVVEIKRGYIFGHPPEDRISLWPPGPERRDKSLAYIVKELSDPAVYERHGVPTSMMMSPDECHEAAKRIEEEAFDAYADEPGEIDSGVRVLRAYWSKIKKAIIDTVKSRGVQPPPASASGGDLETCVHLEFEQRLASLTFTK